MLVSFFVERNEKQRAAGKALLLSAEEGDVGTALVNNHDSVATFDQKLIRRMKTLGVRSYF